MAGIELTALDHGFQSGASDLKQSGWAKQVHQFKKNIKP